MWTGRTPIVGAPCPHADCAASSAHVHHQTTFLTSGIASLLTAGSGERPRLSERNVGRGAFIRPVWRKFRADADSTASRTRRGRGCMVIGMRRHRTVVLVILTLLVAPRAAVAPRAQAAGSLRLYIARHGETEWNVQHKLQGWTDTPLDETGRKQAAALAKSLRGVRLDAIYSSTLSRSRDTALTVAGKTLTVKSLDGLRERNYGHFQGGSDRDPEYERRANSWDDRLDGGESLNQLLARARASLEQIRREHPAGNVLIVGHRITNQMMLRALFDLTPEQTVKNTQDNDEVYLVEIDPGAKPRLWKLIREKNLGDL